MYPLIIKIYEFLKDIVNKDRDGVLIHTGEVWSQEHIGRQFIFEYSEDVSFSNIDKTLAQEY